MKKSYAILFASILMFFTFVLTTVTPVSATTINFEYTGINNASYSAIGTIIYNDPMMYVNPTNNQLITDNYAVTPAITLSMTVIDSTGTNSFTGSDFDTLLWYTHGTTLNMTTGTELVGQNMLIPSWGTYQFGSLGNNGLSGDFNFYASILSSAPSAVNYFTLETAGLDLLALSSLTFDNYNPPVPEPATLLLLGSGFAGLGFLRRKFTI